MRDHGREDRSGDGGSRIVASVTVRGHPQADDGEARRDLVFDFSEMDEISVQDLSVLLTAQRLASADDRDVWATGVPLETWRALRTLGLGHYFRPFPTSGSPDA